MSSYTITESNTFNVTHARHITARIASDLARLTSFYPTELTNERILAFQDEATEYLKAGYLDSVVYGFRKESEDYWGVKSSEWVLALKYVVENGDLSGGSSAPGGILPGIDVESSNFHSFLSPNYSFYLLDDNSKKRFEDNLPLQRGEGRAPTANWRQDRAYGQGGKHVDRYITY